MTLAPLSAQGDESVQSIISDSCTTLAPLSAQGDESVQKLLFLNKRSKSRTAATLVASGPAGVLCVCVCVCVCVNSMCLL